MAASVAGRRGSFKPGSGSGVLPALDAGLVEELCAARGHAWRRDAGKLGPGRTAACFAWQVLMGNVPLDDVRHRAGGAFTASAYCQARQRLPRAVLADLLDRTARAVLNRAGRAGDEHAWRGRAGGVGHRVFRIDGSGVSLPDAPDVRTYFGCSGRQTPGCGYPTMHLLVLTGPGGAGLEAVCSPLRTGDMTHAARTHECLRAGDVLLGDGLFGGCGHLQALRSQGLHGVFPAHHSRAIGFGPGAAGGYGATRRFVRTLGWRDQLVEYRKPRERPKWMTPAQFAAAPEWTLVREVRRWVVAGGGVGREVTLVTTLTDAAAYPAQALVKLLGERWLVELQLRSLKTTMGMERLRCRSVDGVLKEILMYLIVYNLVRLLVLEAAEHQAAPADRVSFADALARLRWGGGGGWVDLELVPDRPGRAEPRVVKRRPKAFAAMTRPRDELRRALPEHRRKRKAA